MLNSEYSLFPLVNESMLMVYALMVGGNVPHFLITGIAEATAMASKQCISANLKNYPIYTKKKHVGSLYKYYFHSSLLFSENA